LAFIENRIALNKWRHWARY